MSGHKYFFAVKAAYYRSMIIISVHVPQLDYIAYFNFRYVGKFGVRSLPFIVNKKIIQILHPPSKTRFFLRTDIKTSRKAGRNSSLCNPRKCIGRQNWCNLLPIVSKFIYWDFSYMPIVSRKIPLPCGHTQFPSINT